MKLSVVIPAMNEEGCIEETVDGISAILQGASIPYEIVVINDNSTDGMPAICDRMADRHDWFSVVHRNGHPGIGNTIAEGLKHFNGDVVAIMMADGSDSGDDLVACYRKMVEENTDCAFGSRWMKGGRVEDYPSLKYIINRLANQMIRMIFWIRYDDVTNAFKLYRRNVIEGVQPILSHHFNILAELPLKAIVRGYTYCVVPISWKNRKTGVAKLKIREMGSRYMFIILYVMLEKWLSMQDYHRKDSL